MVSVQIFYKNQQMAFFYPLSNWLGLKKNFQKKLLIILIKLNIFSIQFQKPKVVLLIQDGIQENWDNLSSKQFLFMKPTIFATWS